ncbi:MAG: UDP-N-acetylmuramoyl-L-alanyl-D-glutamate--2,6-diaminopimelate ligase [Bacteroidetes bacterium]|nr:UDP-N-acetylmuramoyl-L-alanyl-D-glutamate--2,6-diaminopimelate ligase [Bacteroidota bacterium]
MKFTELLNTAGIEKNFGGEDFAVKGLSFDSRNAGTDFVFFAVVGSKLDGTKFIDSAIENGAGAVIADDSAAKSYAKNPKVVLVDNVRKAMAEIACAYYGNPSESIKVIGVTGTNGKTTITYIVKKILEEAGYKAGLIGTIDYITDSKGTNTSRLTTPDSIEMNEYLAKMVKSGMDFCVMEVSSIALVNYRVHTIHYDTAVFTNLTSEHMDLHVNMDNYFRAKKILFDNLSEHSLAVSNSDDDFGIRVLTETRASKKLYSIDNYSNLQASNIELTLDGMSFDVTYGEKTYRVKSSLTGKFNVYNILAAVLTALRYGIEMDVILSAVEKFEAVKGRFNRITLPNGACAIIDYSHTSDSLKNAIEAAIDIVNRENKGGRVITLFGCGGDKDKTKRPVMGHIATELSDFVIVTSDNPRSESPEAIIEDIKTGIEKNNYESEPNRDEAIKRGIEMSRAGDIILICGKGHETYQEIKGVKSHFDDAEEVIKYKSLAK